jgi:hypothetical protein
MPLLRYPHRLYRVYRLYRRYRALGIRVIPRLRPPELPIDCLRCRTRCNPLFTGRRYCPDCVHRIDQSRQRWFRLHLSTCIILSLLIGTLLGVNLLATSEREIHCGDSWIVTDGSHRPPMNLTSVCQYLLRGWPCCYRQTAEETFIECEDDGDKPTPSRLISELRVETWTTWHGELRERHVFFCRCEPVEKFEINILIYDVAVCLLIFVVSAIALEWSARRSDRIAFVRRQ